MKVFNIHKSKRNEYLNTIEPMLYLLRLSGILPFHLDPQENIPYFVSSKIISFVVVVAYILFLIEIWDFTIETLRIEINMGKAVLITRSREILFKSMYTIKPFIIWNKTKALQDYWRAWKNFQSEYEAVLGKPFESKKKKNIKIAAFLCAFGPTARNIYIFMHLRYSYNEILLFMANAHVLLSGFVSSTFWYINCIYIQSMSQDILILGKEIIRRNNNRKLNKLISIWSSLCDLTNDFTTSHSILFLTQFIVVVIAFTMGGYSVLNYSAFKTVYPIAWFLSTLFTSAIFLLLYCETAHLVNQQLNYRQKETLLLENTTKMDPRILNSVSQFLEITDSRNPVINLNGFFNLDRAKFPIIVAFCVNYLLVLRQVSDFRMSI